MADRSEPLPRSATYRWLAQLLLCPPTRPELLAYRSDDGLRFLAECTTFPALKPLVQWITDEMAEGQDLDALHDRIVRAYSRIFDMGGKHGALPYASIYLSDSGRLFQQPARDMAALLQELDMRLPTDLKEPPDHLAVQLQVMAELLDRADQGDDLPLTPSEFLDRYVLTWLPQFAHRCEQQRDPALIAETARAALALGQDNAQAAQTAA
ncbi:molecular chaperone [Ruegeria lacuscaerulensis]|uniref:TorD/DmsD family molecular chaperone n=1 Tax=Ruegeria lacuscaerulensis TaxID=55218 RepID=UPI001481947D|nr:molecular chaperone TorD family protein [Ruegeria lacuscaerulensis]